MPVGGASFLDGEQCPHDPGWLAYGSNEVAPESGRPTEGFLGPLALKQRTVTRFPGARDGLAGFRPAPGPGELQQ